MKKVNDFKFFLLSGVTLIGVFLYTLLYHGFYPMVVTTTLKCNVTYEAGQGFYKNYRGYRESHSIRTMYECGDDVREVTLKTPSAWIRGLRIDPSMHSDTVEIISVSLESKQKKITWVGKDIVDEFTLVNVESLIHANQQSIILKISESKDLQLILPDQIVREFNQWDAYFLTIVTVLLFISLVFLFIVWRFMNSYPLSNLYIKVESKVESFIKKSNTFFINKPRYIWVIPGIIIGFSILLYYFYVLRFAINIPFHDEFHAALELINAYNNLDFPQNILELFRQHNEHRMSSYHILVLAQYKIFDILNFRHIAMFSNMFMLLLFYLFYRLIPGTKILIWALVPVALLLFVPLFRNTDWGLMSMNGIFQYGLVFSSLALLEKRESIAFVSACIIAAFATFSFGNGMFTFPLGFIILLTQKSGSRWRVVIWSFIMIVCIGLYFSDYRSMEHQPSKLMALTMPLQTIQFVLMYFGGVFKPIITYNYNCFTLAGGVIVTLFGLLFWKYRTKWTEDRLMITYILFVAMSAGAAAVSRVGMGLGVALSARYALLPAIFLILLYIYLQRRTGFMNRFIFCIPVIAGCLIMFCKSTVYNIERMNTHQQYLINGQVSFYMDPQTAEVGDSKNNSGFLKILEKAIQNGIYTPPSMDQLKYLAGDIIIFREWVENDNILYRVEYKEEMTHSVLLRGWAILDEVEPGERKIYLAFRKRGNVYFIKSDKSSRSDVYKNLRKKYKNVTRNSGFQIQIHTLILNLEEGSYQMGIAIPDHENKMHVSFTDYILEIPRIDL